LRLLQIERVEAFGEPAVDRSKQFASLLHLALVPPKAGEARRGTQLVSPRLLPSCDAQCVFEGDFALFEPAEAKERDAFKAMKLRAPQTVSGLFIHSQPIPHHRESRRVLALLYQRCG